MADRRLMVLGAAGVLVMVGAALALLIAEGGSADDGEQYRVHISFNETVLDADLEEASAWLREYDRNVDMAILESFPPQGSAIIRTRDQNFCDSIVPQLESMSYISSATCAIYEPTGGDGDEPVSTSSNE
jgi:hypothetical protein